MSKADDKVKSGPATAERDGERSDELRDTLEELVRSSDSLIDRLIEPGPAAEKDPADLPLHAALDELDRTVDDRVSALQIPDDEGEDIQAHLDSVIPSSEEAPAPVEPTAVSTDDETGESIEPEAVPIPSPFARIEETVDFDAAEVEAAEVEAADVEAAEVEATEEIEATPVAEDEKEEIEAAASVEVEEVTDVDGTEAPEELAADAVHPYVPDLIPDFEAAPPPPAAGKRTWLIAAAAVVVLIAGGIWLMLPGSPDAQADGALTAQVAPLPAVQAEPANTWPPSPPTTGSATATSQPSSVKPPAVPATRPAAEPAEPKPNTNVIAGQPATPAPVKTETVARSPRPAPVPARKTPVAPPATTTADAGKTAKAPSPAEAAPVKTAVAKPSPSIVPDTVKPEKTPPAVAKTAPPPKTEAPVETPAKPEPAPIDTATMAPPVDTRTPAAAPGVPGEAPVVPTLVADNTVVNDDLTSIKEPIVDQAVAGTDAPAGSPGPEEVAPPIFEPPTVVNQVKPDYPDRARKRGDSGTITLRVLVGTNGKVLRVIVDEGIPGSELEARAIDAVLRSTYSPGTQGGQPVEAWTTETFVFRP